MRLVDLVNRIYKREVAVMNWRREGKDGSEKGIGRDKEEKKVIMSYDIE